MKSLTIINDPLCMGETFHVGQHIAIAKVVASLVGLGYTKVHRIENNGEFSSRGDILDISSTQAYRIMFFGDEIEAIKQIDIGTFNTKKQLKVVSISPTIDNINFIQRKTMTCIGGMEMHIQIILCAEAQSVYIAKTPPPQMYIKSTHPLKNQLSNFKPSTKVGNLVMHEKYGLGRLAGAKKIALGDTQKPYIMLQYANKAIVYVPFNQINLLYNYHGPSRRLDRI